MHQPLSVIPPNNPHLNLTEQLNDVQLFLFVKGVKGNATYEASVMGNLASVSLPTKS